MTRQIAVLAAVLAVGLSAGALAQQPPGAPAGRPPVTKAVTDASRGNALNNAEFKGPEVIRFIGLKRGQKIADIFGGRFVTAFNKEVGPRGKVYSLTPAEILARYPELPGQQATNKTLAEFKGVEFLNPAFNAMVLPQGLDVVFIRQNYHDLHTNLLGPVDVAAFNRKVFAALKPGGVFVVLDHAALPGSGETAPNRLHRIDPEIVKREVLAAGFVLDGESKVLANAADDHTKMVLDPAILGKTDQFILKFRKPRR
jgi:predicted methyltransferase